MDTATEMSYLTVRIPRALHAEIVDFAERDGRTIQGVVRVALRYYLEQVKTPNPS